MNKFAARKVDVLIINKDPELQLSWGITGLAGDCAQNMHFDCINSIHIHVKYAHTHIIFFWR